MPTFITKADQVFPYFIRTHIPAGVAGLFIAALFGAAMATLSSDLNCISVVVVEDFYRKVWLHATDGHRLHIAKYLVAICGAAVVIFAIQLGRNQGTALSLWYTVSAIVAGGVAGLFLLGFLSTRANRQGAYAGIIANLVFTAWATLTLNGGSFLNLGRYNFPLHEYMIGAIGHIVLVVVGYPMSLFFQGTSANMEALTLWGWLRRDPAPVLPLNGQ